MKFRFRSWDNSLYLFVLGIYLMLFLSALSSGITSWDEETDYLGIRTQIAHAVEFLRGKSPDYRSIHSNLEYYGTAGLLPAWLAWFFQQSFLVGRLTLRQALYEPAADHQLTGFYASSHFILGLEFVLLSLFCVAISRFLGAKYPWLSGSLSLLIPSLLGHSFINPKDLPFALFYTAYTYCLLKRSRSSDPRWLGFSILSAGFLMNQKFVALLPVLISEALLIVVQSNNLRSVRSFLVPSLGLLLAFVLQPASWGLPPWFYLNEAFNTFSLHEWGGCMWWGSTCIGIRNENWSAFVYLLKWWSVKWPFLLVYLLLVRLFFILVHFSRRPEIFLRPSAWWLLSAQIFVIPILAILRNSNLYDADRHMLFAYPALAVIACFGFQSLWDWKGANALRLTSLALVCITSMTMLLDVLLLHPYQSAYLNESARFSHDHSTTALDYWSVSAKEVIRQAQLNGTLTLNPVVDDSLGTLPLFIGLRQLSGHVSKDGSPKLRFQVRDTPAFVDLNGCDKSSEVSRTLISGHRLVMSRLWTCP